MAKKRYSKKSRNSCNYQLGYVISQSKEVKPFVDVAETVVETKKEFEDAKQDAQLEILKSTLDSVKKSKK